MTVSNHDDIIDSRDIIERIEELESEHESLMLDRADAETDEEREEAQAAYNEWQEESYAELQALKALQEDAEGYAPDWRHGATLIRDSYFTDYCEQLCEDIGSIPANCPDYIRDNIDWLGVSNDLMVDYTEVDFDGVTYYVR